MPEPRAARSDEDLVAAWRDGLEWAAAELVRRHARPLARFLGAAGGRDDVDDLVQETFFRAFRKIAGFRGRASFRTWIMTIGSNALKDLRRREARQTILPLEEHDVADPSANPHDVALARDLEANLQEAILGLPDMQRNVFLLRAQQGLPYEEIGEALGTSVGAARVHYHHAVKRLKSILTNE